MTFGAYEIAHGDVLAILKDLPSDTFDGTLSDYPYGLSFMNRKWDYDVPSVEVFVEMLRVLKPGAPLLGFGGSRTFHRVAVNIEDAGFELRDCLMFLHGKGFPKSLNVGLAIDKAAGAERPITGTRILTGNAAVPLKEKGGTYGVQVGSAGNVTVETTGPATDLAKQWDGYGTALKPAFEPIILARKPLSEKSVAANIEKWGVGALAIDACRLDRAEGDVSGYSKCQAHGPNVAMSGKNYPRDPKPDAEGRWPANVCFDEDAAAILDAEVGRRPSTLTGKADPSKSHPHNGTKATSPHLIYGEGFQTAKSRVYADDGGPSRFFYCAKVSTEEREFGCEALPKRSAGEATGGRGEGSAGLSSPRAGAGRGDGAHNHHPTLKRLVLTRWLASLIKPPTEEAVLLVPYSGAGSEIIGALQAGWPMVLGIEQDADYIAIANARIAAWAMKEAV